MSSQREKFARLNVVSPCEADWNEMRGNESKRHCAACNKHVFDFSQMTPRQVEAALAATQGNLCARVTRDETGSLVTLPHSSVDEYQPVYARRNGSPLAKAMVTALLSLSVPMTATLPVLSPVVVFARVQESGEKTPNSDDAASIRGVVTDVNDAVVPNAVVTLISQATLLERTVKTSEEGNYIFQDVAPGRYNLRVEANGFKKLIYEGIALSANQSEQIHSKLETSERFVTMGIVASEPKTLRSLFQESELVAAVTVGQSVLVEQDESSKLIKTALHLNDVMKGETRLPVAFVYRYTYGDEPDETFVTGKSLLAFLKRRRGDDELKLRDGYEATDYQGIKLLTSEELQTYRQRIDDFKALSVNGEPEQAALVEWLVRCAEESATRWDGAYELEKSARQLRDSEEKSAKTLVSLLNESQKHRLVSALIGTPSFTGADSTLLRLVMPWKDQRLVPFMITQLAMMTNEAPPEAEILMSALAELLDDADLKQLAEEYRDVVSYFDNEPGEQASDESVEVDKFEPETEGNLQESAAEEPKVRATTKAERAPYIRKFLTLLANKRSY